jgi:hypothetical protein
VQKVHRNPELLNVLWEQRLCQEGIEEGCRQDTRRKELFEFYHLKEASTEGDFTGLLNTQRLSNRLLELEDCQEALYSPSVGEREEESSFCRGRSYRRSLGRIALCAQGLLLQEV